MPKQAEVVQFKIESQQPESGKWEDTPLWGSFTMTQEQVEAYAQELANVQRCKVRWNWKGVSQGHYAEPEA